MKSYGRVWRKNEEAKVKGKVSNRVRPLLGRCYIYGYLTGPIEHYTDEDFLNLPDIGPATLAEIRVAVPRPAAII